MWRTPPGKRRRDCDSGRMGATRPKNGGMTFVDLRDRYGITQLVFNNEVDAQLCEAANHLGREFVIQVSGKVSERSSKNANMLPAKLR